MIYRLLGELEVGPNYKLLDLPGGPALLLLATLLINVNRQISKAELIRAGWGTDDVKEPQLHKRVMEVRDFLTGIGRRDDIKTRPRFGYEMWLAEDDIDILLFRRSVREADEARAEHRAQDEIDWLWRALRLWRGPRPLANVPGWAFDQDVVSLQQRHKRAAVRLFGVELARGHHELILDELMRVAGFYPTDQPLCELLMTVAYRCGHLTDVTMAYERYRASLYEQTGGDPDPLLRNFHFAVARGEAAAISAAQSAFASRAGTPARPVITVPRQLPHPVRLVGRDLLAAEASRLLGRETRAEVPVVVISGPGGIGKTALALKVAHGVSARYPGGQLYAELHTAAGRPVDPGEVVAQFLHAFGVPRVPETQRERLAAYRTLLADRKVLVVLDDAADGAQVTELVPANPDCAVLVTARQRLPEVSGARHLTPLPPLNHADSVDLFLRVAHDADIQLDDDPTAVNQIVALCGGLPLALRIAGALRVHDHPRPTAELVRRLARQGPEAFVYGQLSVERTIGAGFGRLEAGARQLFLRLGLLPLAGFGVWTAAALLDGTDVEGAAALSQLAASFMIEFVEPDVRYRFHDLTREYARRRAQAEFADDPGGLADDPGAAASRVYRSLLTLTRRAHRALCRGDFEVVHSAIPDWEAPAGELAEIDRSPQAWFEKERLNIRAAVEHCAGLGLTEACWDLAVSAHEFYTICGYFDDWQATHMTALRACRSAGDRRGEGIVLACLNQPALIASRPAGDVSHVAELEQSASLLASCADRHGQAIALRTLANALRRLGHITRPLALFSDALAHYVASGDVMGESQTLRFIGQTHLDRGHHEQARQVLAAAETVALRFDGLRQVTQTRYWIGQACLAVGDLDGAQAAFDWVGDVFGDDHSTGGAYAAHGQGEVALSKGGYGAAERYLGQAADFAQSGSDAVLLGRVWLSMARLRHAQGRSDEQLAAVERAVGIFAECDAAYLQARALAALAAVLADRGYPDGAETAWARIAALYDAAGLPEHDRIYRRPGG